jgi:hypothetical protein
MHGQGTGAPGSSTRYLIPGINGLQSTAYSILLPACVIKNFRVRQAQDQPGSSPGDDMVIEIYSGDPAALAATGIKVTFTGGSTPQTRTDLVNTYNHTAGEAVHVRLINSSGSTSAAPGGVTFEVDFS